MQRRLIAICAFLCLVLCACGTKQYDEGANADSSNNYVETNISIDDVEIPHISKLLFEQNDIKEIQIETEQIFSRTVYVITNQEERESFIQILFGVQMDEFEDAEQPSIMGSSVKMRIRTDDAEKNVQVLSDGSVLYIAINDGENQIFLKGTAKSFPFKELNQLVTVVLGNEDDPDYAGIVTVTGTSFEDSVNKGNCAFAMNILDNAIKETGTSDANTDIAHNVELKVGNTIYGINSDTGQFFRETDDDIMYAQLEDEELAMVIIRLGVRTATQ